MIRFKGHVGSKTVEVAHIRAWDINNNLKDAIKKFQELLSLVPVEYRDEANFEVDWDTEYDETYAFVRVWYMRPLTPEEQEAAEKDARLRNEQQIRHLENQLLILKNKS